MANTSPDDIFFSIFDILDDMGVTTLQFHPISSVCRRWRSAVLHYLHIISFFFDDSRRTTRSLGWLLTCINDSSRSLDVRIAFVGSAASSVENHIAHALAANASRIVRLSMGPGHSISAKIELSNLISLHHSFENINGSRDKITDLGFPLQSIQALVQLSSFVALNTLSISSFITWPSPTSDVTLPTLRTLHLSGNIKHVVRRLRLPGLQTVRVYGEQALYGIDPLVHNKGEYETTGLLNTLTLELPTGQVPPHRLVMILSSWMNLSSVKMAQKFQGCVNRLLQRLIVRTDCLRPANPGVSYEALEDFRLPVAGVSDLSFRDYHCGWSYYIGYQEEVFLDVEELVRLRNAWV